MPSACIRLTCFEVTTLESGCQENTLSRVHILTVFLPAGLSEINATTGASGMEANHWCERHSRRTEPLNASNSGHVQKRLWTDKDEDGTVLLRTCGAFVQTRRYAAGPAEAV